MSRVIVLILLLGGLAAPAAAKSGRLLTSDELIRLCATPDDRSEKEDCLGYVTGVADALDGNAIDGIRACVPADVSRKQVRDAVVTWLKSNPQLHRFRAASLVATAIAKAYPCR
jgi:hypothetical protein